MPPLRIADMPAANQQVRFVDGFGQRFLVTVDTEEEFDWSREIRREGHTLLSVTRLARFQEFCETHAVVPLYLVDYPIATSPAARDALGPAIAAGKAEVGLQLHPWVNPPHDEEVTTRNSFAGNLPRELEREKFARLHAAIVESFGVTPQIYRAGRYGLGPNSAEMLIDHDMAIDTSVRSRFDYSSEGGPNFRDLPVWPWWVDRPGGLMELPLTTVYWGPLRQLGPWLYPKMWRVPRLRGLLARVGMLERIPLTPEGVRLDEVIRGIDMALDEGLPVLNFSFHSPSLAPGFTPYVRSEDDLDALYDWWRAVFAYLARRQVRPTSVKDLMRSVALA